MINIIKDRDLMLDINKYDMILVPTNVYCSLTQGFQRDVALNYPYVRTKNLNTKYGDIDKLGKIILCEDEIQKEKFCLMYICKGYPPRPKKGELDDYLSYESLENCLIKINVLYKGLNIASPYLGCSRFDGNGNKDKVFNIVNSIATNFNLTMYDYKQKTREEKLKEIRLKELDAKSRSYEEYREMVKKRKEEAEKRFKLNGFARY